MLSSLQVLQNQGQQPQNQQGQQGQQLQQGGLPPPPPPQNGQDYTLSSVLHFLQTEWRRYERDRNEWEIERAEMRARIALLEGERRSFENIKLDLMRRIKMLEYALRMERSKQLNQPSSSNASSKLSTLQSSGASSGQKDETGSQKGDSGGSSPRSEDSPLPESRLPNGTHANGPATRPNSWGPANWASVTSGGAPAPATYGKPPAGRDPKSRARSRDYLKQCLQEISYLTSPQAMNPLPNRPLLNSSNIPSMAIPNVPSFDSIPFNGRPRKIMPESGKEFPVLNGMNTVGPSSGPPPNVSQVSTAEHNGVPPQQPSAHTQEPEPQPQQPPETQPEASEKEGQPSSHHLTAIFQPGENWKDQLRKAHEAAQQAARDGQEPLQSDNWRGEELKEEEHDIESEESVSSEGGNTKTWKAKRTLRNHLDAVRAIAFHPNELCLATGGDDYTVKIWRMEVSVLASSNTRPTTEVEPQLTLRGHSSAITRLVHSPAKGLLYSASLDCSIRIWALPTSSHTTYAPYDETRSRGELIGHTDAVWDLALVRDEGTLISCGAEGAVKVWDVSGPLGGGSLKLTWGYNGVIENPDDLNEDMTAPGATAVEAIKTDLKKVAVAYQNAVVKIFDIETGKEVSKLSTDISYDGTPATQINCLTSHPTMPLLVTGHEDRYIRIFDLATGQCTHSMLAHLDGVTSLSIDAAGFSLVSGSHDCSVRFWDLLGGRTCVQEISAHREKAREGVLDVDFHPSLPFMASAGADGVVKLYASS
ncbi:peptidase C14 [Coprinopsis cinerea AmutBmut pab1-1]|nr:peptidase C14 [Coprinopsis cinerea AmutBmut pab1-1]